MEKYNTEGTKKWQKALTSIQWGHNKWERVEEEKDGKEEKMYRSKKEGMGTKIRDK